MSYSDLEREGIIDQLARLFSTREEALPILDSINYPRERLPGFNQSADFWRSICRDIEAGVIDPDYGPLIDATIRRYPKNAFFSQFRPQAATPPLPETGTNLVVIGWPGGQDELNQLMQTLSAETTGGQEVMLNYISNGIFSFYLVNGNARQAAALAQRLRAQVNPPTQVILGSEGQRDYLLDNIFIEGPDHARFMLSNIPASTPVRDVANAMMAQYQETWPRDARDRPRQAVIDRVGANGATERVANPDRTLNEMGVREGEGFQVSPESTAANINPIIRAEALARVRVQILNFAKSHAGFQVKANSQQAPTEYYLSFLAPGWAPAPNAAMPPIPIQEHEVNIFLSEYFPLRAPEVTWVSPIFHPNVEPQRIRNGERFGGGVCLGELADRYRPGMDFGQLCQLLIDIASYQNYQIREGLNPDALRWVKTVEGQTAITARGGLEAARKENEDYLNTLYFPNLKMSRVV
ncbi:MAG: hypothetical protein IT260_00890 [Saprospiraceae bacterium]|nr:hypothetical protein [Saprospiraceae bacterium]